MVANLFIVTGITPKVDGSKNHLTRNNELQQVIQTTCGVEEVEMQSLTVVMMSQCPAQTQTNLVVNAVFSF